jgi:hypothetical protein
MGVMRMGAPMKAPETPAQRAGERTMRALISVRIRKAGEPMADTNIAEVAESDAHARWIIEQHVAGEAYGARHRCTICAEWWPCGMVGLAALAVEAQTEVARLTEQLRIAVAENAQLRAALRKAYIATEATYEVKRRAGQAEAGDWKRLLDDLKTVPD